MVRVSKAAVEDRNQPPGPDRDRGVRGPGENRVPGAARSHAVDENQEADLARRGGQERGRDRNQRQSAEAGHAAGNAAALVIDVAAVGRIRDPERIARGPNGSHALEVVPGPVEALGIVTGGDTVVGQLPLLESHEQSRGPPHLNEDRVAVLGLCRGPQTAEAAPGRKLFPKIMLATM